MITDYFESSRTLESMRTTCVGAHLDDLAGTLAAAGFATLTICEHLRTAAQLGRWAQRHRLELARWNDDMLKGFRRHLVRRKVGKRARVLAQAAQFLVFLRTRGLIEPAKQTALAPKFAAILDPFDAWMLRHRGVVPRTLLRYRRILVGFLAELGDDPTTYDVASIRSFVIVQLGRRSRGETKSAVTAIRSFLRFLVAEGRIPPGIEYCVPTVPQWRLSSLPRYLEAPDVERVVGSCDLTTGHGMRDHAILMLLSRLGLRAGDIVGMTLADVDWKRGTLCVRGKSHRETILPLPQDVGDALLAYLKQGRPRSDSDRMFLTVFAPTRPFASSSSVCDIVRFALARAEVRNPPSRGAHLLRHSAATAMLRAGGSLETIATVLRHRSPDTTAYYAKVDVGMLKQVAQPWPVGVAC
jgi:integrase/recombinase XerD